MIQISSLKGSEHYRYDGTCGADTAGPCAICGKAVKDKPTTAYVHMHEGGAVIVTEAEADELNRQGKEGGDMGAQPIGPDCLRKNAGALAPYVQR